MSAAELLLAHCAPPPPPTETGGAERALADALGAALDRPVATADADAALPERIAGTGGTLRFELRFDARFARAALRAVLGGRDDGDDARAVTPGEREAVRWFVEDALDGPIEWEEARKQTLPEATRFAIGDAAIMIAAEERRSGAADRRAGPPITVPVVTRLASMPLSHLAALAVGDRLPLNAKVQLMIGDREARAATLTPRHSGPTHITIEGDAS